MQRGDRCNITKDFREYIGREYTTNEGYKITILDYIGRHEILIKFNDNPDVTIWTTLQNIKNGQIKNPYKRSVYNIGYYGIGNYTARNNNIKTEEYMQKLYLKYKMELPYRLRMELYYVSHPKEIKKAS